MNYEVEMKFVAPEWAEIEKRLAEFGAAISPARTEVDRYFAHPARDFAQTDEAFRVRQRGDQFFVTYKGPKLDQTTKSRRELELGLPSQPGTLAAWTELLELLGFRPVADVTKSRRKSFVAWRGRRVEVSLDEVAEVGRYVELELVVAPELFDEARSCIVALAERLGLQASERRSYLRLLLVGRAARV